MYLSTVVAADPAQLDARRLLAEILASRGQVTVARESLSPIIESATADPEELSLIAYVDLLSGNEDEAISILKKAVSVEPNDAILRLQLAFALLRAGKKVEAAEHLNHSQAEKEFPPVAARHTLSVLSLLAEGRSTDAATEAERFAGAYSDHAIAHLLNGIVCFSAGQYDNARLSFEKAYNLDPDELNALWFLAKLDEIDGSLESAYRRFGEILEQDPSHSMALLGMASLASAMGQSDEKVDWLEQVRSSRTPYPEAMKELAREYLSQGRLDEAAQLAMQTLSLAQSDPELHNILGVAQFGLGRHLDAQSSFRTALQRDIENNTYRFNLSLSQAKSGRVTEAIDTLQQADESESLELDKGMLLVALRADLGNLDEALRMARLLAELYPNEGSAHAMLGELLAQRGDFEGAAGAYTVALAHEQSSAYSLRAYELNEQAGNEDAVAPLRAYLANHPDDSHVRLYYAQALQAQGDLAASASEYETVVESEPENFAAINNLAWIYFLRGDDRAEQTARRAYGLAPSNSAVVDTLGWLLLSRGELDESIDLLRRAVALDGRDGNKRFHLAAALAKSGQREEAKAILEELVAKDHVFTSRREAQELLVKL